MADKHPIEGIMGISMEKIREMVDVNTIIGEPITAAEGTVIIPVSKVAFGFASGGSDLPTQAAERFAGGSGAGVTVRAEAFIVVKKDGSVQLLEMGKDKSAVSGLVDALPDIIEKIKQFIPKKDKDAEEQPKE